MDKRVYFLLSLLFLISCTPSKNNPQWKVFKNYLTKLDLDTKGSQEYILINHNSCHMCIDSFTSKLQLDSSFISEAILITSVDEIFKRLELQSRKKFDTIVFDKDALLDKIDMDIYNVTYIKYIKDKNIILTQVSTYEELKQNIRKKPISSFR